MPTAAFVLIIKNNTVTHIYFHLVTRIQFIFEVYSASDVQMFRPREIKTKQNSERSVRSPAC